MRYEDIYRFSQIVDNAKNLDEMILHIPDYYADDFYKELKKKDIKFLKSIKNLHINIMNQNIELMPEPEQLKDLYIHLLLKMTLHHISLLKD